jgi:cell division protein ZapD
VNQVALEQTLARLEPLLVLLKSSACQPGSKLRGSDLISQVRQRLAIPGGMCSFDLPGFHHWLNGEPSRRAAQLNDWMEDLRIIEDAVHITLKLVRESAAPRRVTAAGGFYQQNLDPASACQIVRVLVADTEQVFPEISGGKHRFTVRFLRYTEQCARPQQTAEDIPFELQCCGL